MMKITTILFPVHPRIQAQIEKLRLDPACGNLKLIAPVSYLDMLVLMSHARAIVTDSGGMQKEAYFLETPCLTLRPETEWVETLIGGWNRLVEIQKDRIIQELRDVNALAGRSAQHIADGWAARTIVSVLGH